MKFIAILDEALDEALCRTAFFAEPHTLKGLLALNRLRTIPGIDDEFIGRALQWNHVLQTPRADVLIHEHITFSTDSLADSRLQSMIQGAVFPMAYAAGVEWVRRKGFKHLVESFKDRAMERIGFLGHSWSIWCSFLEIDPYLETHKQEFTAAERFVEFCASQLSSPHWTVVYDIDFDLETHDLDEEAIVTSVINRPGFYGHGVIALAYLFEYRSLFSEAQWAHGLKRLYDNSQTITGSPTFDIEVPKPAESQVGEEDPGSTILSFLNRASKEVHSLTLADSVLLLWKHLAPEYRPHLLNVLEVFGDWDLERTASGERKDR